MVYSVIVQVVTRCLLVSRKISTQEIEAMTIVKNTWNTKHRAWPDFMRVSQVIWSKAQE